ncbi:MAG: glycosyltransferase [Lachnospiraceae bacterium]
MDKVKISVVMGVFNPKDRGHLYQATMSIVNQSFTQWEMIICDDGSSAEYMDAIKSAVSLDSRIKHIRSNRNHGLAHALNQGISASRGKYIARMDADDISKPDRLEKLYHFLEEHPQYDWVGSNSELFDDNGVWGIGSTQAIPTKKDFLEHSPYIHPSVMFRREILIDMKGYKVSEQTVRCEDYELFMRLHKHGYQGYNIQEELIQYREDDNSYTRRKYKYCIREMQIRLQGFRKLGILNVHTSPYVIKPLIVGLLWPRMLGYLKKNVRNNNYVEGQRNSQI